MLHRDLKPSNVLVDRTGRVVVLDLGLVADLGAPSPEPRHYIVGTVNYMSPEQILDGAALSAASDWYSVGVVLYEALTGIAEAVVAENRRREGTGEHIVWVQPHRDGSLVLPKSTITVWEKTDKPATWALTVRPTIHSRKNPPQRAGRTALPVTARRARHRR